MDARLFYDDDLDALRATVQSLGGYKVVALKIWPDKTADAGGRMLADCCNAGRSERLKPSQLLLVMRLGREAGIHCLAEHFMAEAGYTKPVPLDPRDETATLLQHLDDTMAAANQLATRIERIRNRGAL